MYQELIGRTPSKTDGPNGLIPGVESNLDVQYIMSVSGGKPSSEKNRNFNEFPNGLGVDTWVFSTSELHGGQEPFLRWIQTVAAVPQADVPKVQFETIHIHFTCLICSTGYFGVLWRH